MDGVIGRRNSRPWQHHPPLDHRQSLPMLKNKNQIHTKNKNKSFIVILYVYIIQLVKHALRSSTVQHEKENKKAKVMSLVHFINFKFHFENFAKS